MLWEFSKKKSFRDLSPEKLYQEIKATVSASQTLDQIFMPALQIPLKYNPKTCP